MKKLLLFMFAIVAFAACEQAPIEEQSAVRQDAPETITVGFEGDDTRIQLNDAQKTIWTKGDLVSVFYRSNANQQWKYDGETGARTAELKRVDEGNATETMKRVVVVYPYNDNYYINTETYNVQASLPAVQNYLKDSYGTNGNIMISSSEYNQFSLKSVCGWLKLQLTGDGETIKSIKFRGNDGEQVAGELYINSTDATAALASDMGDADDNNAGGSLVFEDTILTEVTLDCGEGVALGKEATAFYIALPPQTFEKGFKVVIKDTEGYVMEQSTDKTLIIERNHIQPMAEFEYETIPNNQIWYTSSDGNVVTPYNTDAFGANIISNTYTDGMGVITFDGDVTSIGEDALYKCTSLTSVNIPDSVTTIGGYAFYYCTSLTSVNIPDSVTAIGTHAFYYCTSLTSVNIPDSITTIGNYAFAWCDSLTSVNIPDSVTTIGGGAFHFCTSLTEFTGKFAEDNGRILVVDGVLTAFAPAGITQYTIPDSVTSIGYWAFGECPSLTSVNIPDSVTTIGDYAFADCDSLTSVYCKATTPPALGGTYVFDDNGSGRKIYVPTESVETYKSTEYWSEYASAIVGYDFENGEIVEVQPNNEIWYTSSDGNIIKPYYTKVFGANIISNTYNNGKGVITFDGDVTSIGEDAFYKCTSLTSVNIPDSVTTIGVGAFRYCDSLTSVNIPDSVTEIGEYAFRFCDSLTEFTGKFAEDNGRILVVDGVLTAFAPAGITQYTIPDSVTTIGSYACASCYRLTSVNIPDSVTTIGGWAFYECISLTSVNIPDSVTEIGSHAFADCTSLTSVNIGDSVTEIGEWAFYGCESLTSVNIPDSVTTIGNDAFSNCTSLTSVNIPDSVTEIGEYAFYYCYRLTSVNIPDSITEIGDAAFADCKSLKEFKGKYATEDGRSLIVDNRIIAYANASGTRYTIPDSVTSIGEDAFYNCDRLTSVNIPDSVTKIGSWAFANCDSLTSVYCKATTPPSLGNGNVFDDNGSGRKIYVPAGSVEAYKSATRWSEYADAIVGYNF